MKAVRVHETGGLKALRFEDVPLPAAAVGQVVVKLHAIGVNFIDIYYRTGLYKSKEMPFTLGQEAAGDVVEVGAGVRDVKVGDRVAFTGIQGSYAEVQAVPADRLVALPTGVSYRDGAAALLQGMTAQYLATSAYPLKPGDTCLVHAAAGGVGLLLVQIAKLRGATVIGTVSTAEKERLAQEAGADHVIRYTEQDFEVEVKRITGGKGLAVVFDGVGRTTFEKGLNCLRRRGMMVLFGQSSGPVPPFDLGQLNVKGSLFLTRPSLGAYTAERSELVERAAEVFGCMRDGKLKVRIGAEFPLAQVADAHRALEGRETAGKVLLLP